MSNAVLSARDHYVGQTYQDIALTDGDDLPSVLRERNNPPQPTADIPFSHYTDRAFFDLEMQKMWRRVWQYACREEHVPEVGDYYVYDLGRSSLIMLRTQQGLRAYHNSCLHRGTKLKPSQSSSWSAKYSMSFPWLGLESRREPEERTLRLGISTPEKGQGGSAAGAGGKLERLHLREFLRAGSGPDRLFGSAARAFPQVGSVGLVRAHACAEAPAPAIGSSRRRRSWRPITRRWCIPR